VNLAQIKTSRLSLNAKLIGSHRDAVLWWCFSVVPDSSATVDICYKVCISGVCNLIILNDL